MYCLKQKDVNYTTTLKLMQIMADKGILKRDESQMKHIYSVAEEEQKPRITCLKNLLIPCIKVRQASW